MLSEWGTAQNILIVRMDNIGDVFLLGPALRAVKETLPQARLTLLTSHAGATASGLLPWVDEVIAWNAIWQGGRSKNLFEPVREHVLIQLLREYAFDAAIIFTTWGQSPHIAGYLCYLAGIPLRAGIADESGGSILSTEVRGLQNHMHQVDRYLALVEHLGMSIGDRQLSLELSPYNRSKAIQLLQSQGIEPQEPFILLHPGALSPARSYPAQGFAWVVRLLTARGWSVLVTGLESEEQLVRDVVADTPGVACLIGETKLGEYVALIERAALVICNNTLPMHLADALKKPQVVLYAGTEVEERWQPRVSEHLLLRRATACYPCGLWDCPIGQNCLSLEPLEIVEKVEGLLQRERPVK